MTPQRGAPMIWLQHAEVAGEADCGCYLDSDHDDDGTPAMFLCQLHAAAPAMREALAALFEHCAMIHKHWGEGDNTREATAAIAAANAALAAANGEGEKE